MEANSVLIFLVLSVLVALIGGLILERFKQPSVIGYILAGVVLGSLFPEVLPSDEAVTLAGDFGLVFLLFFVGTEAKLDQLLEDWKVSLLGTTLQIILSVLVCWGAGQLFDWGFSQALFFGICISLSSTAVVLKILEEFGGTSSLIGRQSLGILLVQDLAVIPLLILFAISNGKSIESFVLTKQILGGGVITALTIYMSQKGRFKIPQWLTSKENEDFQTFTSIVLCLGGALITGWLELSPALGAFLAGLLVGSIDDGDQFISHLKSFKVLFVAFFFVSVGLIFDLNFILENWIMVLSMSVIVLVINTALMGGVLVLMGVDRITALVSGCLLAQIGEFAFLFAANALKTDIISQDMYLLTISAIVVSLILSPLWLTISRKLLRISIGRSATIAFKSIEIK